MGGMHNTKVISESQFNRKVTFIICISSITSFYSLIYGNIGLRASGNRIYIYTQP